MTWLNLQKQVLFVDFYQTRSGIDCRTSILRYKAASDEAIQGHGCAEKQCKHKLADKQTKIRR